VTTTRKSRRAPSLIDKTLALFREEWRPLVDYVEKHMGGSASPAAKSVRPTPKPASQAAPIALNHAGSVASELRIRLAGFGGLLPGDVVDATTVKAIEQFETDVMGRTPTGKVDVEFARRLDKFALEYPIPFASQLACTCKVCGGFGMGRHKGEYSEKYAKSKNEAGNQYEYPGIHRSLLWAARALMFYATKDKPDSLRFIQFSSGYRCHDNNRQSGRKTTNHMGKAVDIQFGRQVKGKWQLAEPAPRHDDADTGREIAKERMRAQVGWGETDRFSLEPGGDGTGHAPTWVHLDVRTWSKIHLADDFFTSITRGLDGRPMEELLLDPSETPTTAQPSPETESRQSDEIRRPESETEQLLAAVIYCESGSKNSHGENADEKDAIAACFLNRVYYGKLHSPSDRNRKDFGDTLARAIEIGSSAHGNAMWNRLMDDDVMKSSNQLRVALSDPQSREHFRLSCEAATRISKLSAPIPLAAFGNRAPAAFNQALDKAPGNGRLEKIGSLGAHSFYGFVPGRETS
jgi:hypothetical protein